MFTTVTMNLDGAITNLWMPAQSHIRQPMYTADKPHHLSFKDFVAPWDFFNVTSNPECPQAKGPAAKQLMAKLKKDSKIDRIMSDKYTLLFYHSKILQPLYIFLLCNLCSFIQHE